ncbi:MAG: GntR family transcriptional regulator [Syntrophomonadaceae bacterium]|nr:GntR family transcriptional regulator [Syntrophomonadaceae bacterium]
MEKRLMPVNLENHRPLRELVFDALKDAIVRGALKPGDRLMEVQLAEELGVSRTPVREAIRKLELEDLAVMIPRKGAYVSSMSLKDIADLFEIRVALEVLAAGLAAERITHEELEDLERILVMKSESIEETDFDRLIEIDVKFHDGLYKASRNEKLAQIINNLHEQIYRFRRTSLASPGRMKEALEEHRKIVEAISQRNIVLAQALAQEHIENAENSLFDTMQNTGAIAMYSQEEVNEEV